MLKSIVSITLLVLLSACAHQSGGENTNDTKSSSTRVDDAINDGYCDSQEARDPAGSPDCQRQSRQQKSQRSALPGEELLNDQRIGDLGRELDRGLPSLGNDRLGL